MICSVYVRLRSPLPVLLTSLYTFHLNPEMALECELYILLLRYTDYLIICASFGVTKNISSSPF